MATTKDLELRLLQAHLAGDKRLLVKLQAEFPRTRTLTRSGPPPSVVDTRGGSSSAPTTTRARVTSLHLANGIRGRLQDEAFADADGREAGGFLFGCKDGDDAVVITDMSHTASAERERDRIWLDIDSAKEIERWSLHPIIGSWHTHRKGDGDPSDTDRRTCLRAAERHPDDIDVSIIVTPHPTHGWAASLSARVAEAGKITEILGGLTWQ